VRQVGYLQRVYRDARSTEHKISEHSTVHKEVYASDVFLVLNYLNITRVHFTSISLSKSRGKQAVVVVRGTVL
jgi:ribosomal protein L10